MITPASAGAFWPFSVTKAETGGGSPLIHDSSIGLLAAAVNADPNPVKGSVSLAIADDSALVPYAGPDGSLSAVEPASPAGQITSYVVKEGDSISSIAARFGVSTNTVLWSNNLSVKSSIRPGMTLVILPVSGVQHTVLKGETLAGIAKSFGADADDIASYNGLESGAGLAAGDVLIIPGGELSAPSTKSTAAPAKTAAAKASIKTGGSMGAIKAVGDTSHAGSFVNPVPGARLTQKVHGWNGVDLGAPSGTPVYAAAGGTVIVSRVGGWNGGYGDYVVIDHGNGTQTLYAHLSADTVSVGQSVAAGQKIGAVGKTGEATGNHLHFEVRGAQNPFVGCAEMSFCSI
jgi:murein DD-endopeptidase MepM/ murein hydrolase activator NlpD